MDYDAWTGCYKRLCVLYGRPVKGAQAAEYFKVLDGFTAAVMDEAIVAVAREHRTWPSAAVLLGAARGVVRGLTLPASACSRCGGAGWIAAPDQEHHGRVYTNYMQRCGECRAQPEPVA